MEGDNTERLRYGNVCVVSGSLGSVMCEETKRRGKRINIFFFNAKVGEKELKGKWGYGLRTRAELEGPCRGGVSNFWHLPL